MYPLIYKDGDTIPYVALVYLLFLPLATSLITEKASKRSSLSLLPSLLPQVPTLLFLFLCNSTVSFIQLSGGGIVILHFLFAAVDPPSRLPDLFTLSIAAFSFVHFFGLYCLWTYVQMTGTHNVDKTKRE